jgi:hypothetical protein
VAGGDTLINIAPNAIPMNFIDSFIFQTVTQTPQFREKLTKEIIQLQVKKGEVIQSANSLVRNGYFVKKGLLRPCRYLCSLHRSR